MAHFQDVKGVRISGTRVIVSLGQIIEVGLSGPKDFNGQELDVVSTDERVASVVRGALRGDVLTWNVTGKSIGRCMLHTGKKLSGVLRGVETAGQEIWDSITIEVSEILAWGKKVSAEFKSKVIKICERLQMNPSDLMAVMHAESGLNPRAPNENPNTGKLEAIGLIQFTEVGAQAAGTTLEALRGMNALQQLDYVERYFAPFKGRLKTVDDVYCVTAARIAVGQPPDFVLYAKEREPGVYERNRILDLDHNGKIEKWEIGQRGRNSLQEGLKPGNVG
jgi:hypothetical protein